jgi:hypothetical protein
MTKIVFLLSVLRCHCFRFLPARYTAWPQLLYPYDHIVSALLLLNKDLIRFRLSLSCMLLRCVLLFVRLPDQSCIPSSAMMREMYFDIKLRQHKSLSLRRLYASLFGRIISYLLTFKLNHAKLRNT